MTEKVCIIIPAFNEELYIGHFLDSVMSLSRQTPDYTVNDILVVDDGSSDRTAEIARQKGAKVLSLPKNYGKAFAFFKGAQYAKTTGASVVVTLDADLKRVTNSQIDMLLRPIINNSVKMTVGRVSEDVIRISGQRAIRMSALKPLFEGNRKWEMYFGVKQGRFKIKTGFGLENALNITLGERGRNSISLEYRYKPRIEQIVKLTNFETQRFYGEKVLSDHKTSHYGQTLNQQMARPDQIFRARIRKAREIKEMRLTPNGSANARKKFKQRKNRLR